MDFGLPSDQTAPTTGLFGLAGEDDCMDVAAIENSSLTLEPFPMEEEEPASSTEVGTSTDRLLNLHSLMRLPDSTLLDAFAKGYANESLCKFYYECLLIPEKCNLIVSSNGIQETARQRMLNHLKRHAKAFLKQPDADGLRFTIPAEKIGLVEQSLEKERVEKNAEEPKTDSAESQEDSNGPLAVGEQERCLKLPALGVSIKELEPQGSGVVVDFHSTLPPFQMVLDLWEKSILVDQVRIPVELDWTDGGFIAGLVNDGKLGKEEWESEEAELSCNESLEDFVSFVVFEQLQEDLTRAEFPHLIRDHRYCRRRIRYGKPFLRDELNTAIAAFNIWKARIVGGVLSGVGKLVAVEQEESVELLALRRVAGVQVENDITPTSHFLPPYMSFLAAEVTCSSRGWKRSPVTQLGELLWEAGKSGPSEDEEAVEALQQSPWILPSNPDPFPANFGKLSPEEICKRDIALEALAELRMGVRADVKRPKQLGSSRTCKICQQTFTACSSLRAHYRSHAGVKPFRCQICSASFTRKHSLNYHLLCHSGEIKYKCPWCQKDYRHAGHFKDHIRIHQSQPFYCSVCGFSFANRTTLRRHLRLSHGMDSASTGSRINSDSQKTRYNKSRERHFQAKKLSKKAKSGRSMKKVWVKVGGNRDPDGLPEVIAENEQTVAQNLIAGDSLEPCQGILQIGSEEPKLASNSCGSKIKVRILSSKPMDLGSTSQASAAQCKLNPLKGQTLLPSVILRLP